MAMEYIQNILLFSTIIMEYYNAFLHFVELEIHDIMNIYWTRSGGKNIEI